jgi:hypothetical protein
MQTLFQGYFDGDIFWDQPVEGHVFHSWRTCSQIWMQIQIDLIINQQINLILIGATRTWKSKTAKMSY